MRAGPRSSTRLSSVCGTECGVPSVADYFLDIGRAVLACTDPTLADHAPGPEYSWDADPQMGGFDGQNLLMWRWLCATGVYHAASNTLSVEALQAIGRRAQTPEQALCVHQNVWNEDSRYFDRCAAGLGMIDAMERMAKVLTGDCPVTPNKPPAAWERHQLQQFGPPLQLSCNPASATTGFTVAMSTCPAAFRMHFPCVAGAPDERICSGEWFGEDVNKDDDEKEEEIFGCTTYKPGLGRYEFG